MPRYVVHIVKREVVVLGAELSVTAKSIKAARAKAEKLHRDDKIDECLWYEEDSWYTDDPLEIKSVERDGLF